MSTAVSPQRAVSAGPAPAGPVLSVAMAIDAFRPVLGGAQLQLERLGPLLRERGVQPTVLTRRVDAASPRRAREHGLDVRRLGVPGAPAAASAVYAARGAAWVAATRPDVVHAHGLLSAATLALVGGGVARRPVVAKVLSSGVHGDVARLRTKLGGPARLHRLLRTVAAFVAVSAEVEDELRRLGVPARRVRRIPNGVDVDHHRPAGIGDEPLAVRRTRLRLPVDGPLVVTCGRLDARKRLDLLVEAQARVPGTLLVVGEGPERTALVARARAAGVADRVTFRPTVDDVAPYLRAADAYATASAQDGLSNAVLEAMACGLPVVAARAGGMAQLVDDRTGALVRVASAAELGAALATLLADPDGAIARGLAGRARVVADYGLAATADRLVALYRELAGG
jgi:glycosyltransferase involved in cell wall biosynthesis